MNKLFDILSYSRRHNSPGEQFIIDKYIIPLDPVIFSNDKGEPMAYTVNVGRFTGILWSCHTDTVHSAYAPLTHRVVVTTPDVNSSQHPKYISLSDKNSTNCLGADDGAGMWLLLEMIKAGVHGTYIFHRGEECGGIGSRHMEKYEIEFLSQFTHAIAFDRRDASSIITYQLDRCCSDKFADDFSGYLYELSDSLIELELDSTGVFTDTANYIGIIPECTNISVGYHNEHTANEWLDLSYLKTLRDTMVKFDGSRALEVYPFPIDSCDYKVDSMPILQTEADIRDLVYNNPEDAIRLISYYII